MNKAEAGRLGGKSTFEKHGRTHMSAMGKVGGRPRNLSLAELKALKA